MRGFLYFVCFIAICIWGPPITGWFISGMGVPVQIMFFIVALAMGAFSWHVARWLSTGKNW